MLNNITIAINIIKVAARALNVGVLEAKQQQQQHEKNCYLCITKSPTHCYYCKEVKYCTRKAKRSSFICVIRKLYK